jgi:hypothetical protein
MHFYFCNLVPSQCYLSKNLTNKNLNSVASKVLIQMTAKLGGVPWSIKVPLKVSTCFDCSLVVIICINC